MKTVVEVEVPDGVDRKELAVVAFPGKDQLRLNVRILDNPPATPDNFEPVLPEENPILGYGLQRKDGEMGSWLYPFKDWADAAIKASPKSCGYKLVPLIAAIERATLLKAKAPAVVGLSDDRLHSMAFAISCPTEDGDYLFDADELIKFARAIESAVAGSGE